MITNIHISQYKFIKQVQVHIKISRIQNSFVWVWNLSLALREGHV